MIENMGFRLFHMEPNPWVIFDAAEFSFIHESLILPPTSEEESIHRPAGQRMPGRPEVHR